MYNNMEVMIWEIVRDYGAYWILAVLSFLLWNKNEKKDAQIHDMIKVMSQIWEQNIKTSEKLSEISNLLLQVLISKDTK